jgi:acyl carrier protein
MAPRADAFFDEPVNHDTLPLSCRGHIRRLKMASTEDKIRDIIVELLGVEPERVTRDARFREDLEADSLDLVELIMEFEQEFGGEISDEEAQKIETVGQVIDYVEKNML